MERNVNNEGGVIAPVLSQRRESLSILARFMIACVRIYQQTLGPVMGGHCRFTPTCSFYAIEALQTHGAFKGGWLTLRRLLRCQPWGGMGHDPVPEHKSQEHP